MKHRECRVCKHCAWVAKIEGKWICECIRPKYWGKIEEDDKDCEFYQFFGWKEDMEDSFERGGL